MIHRIRNTVLWLMNWRKPRFWILFFVVAPTAYVLSIGPIIWLIRNDHIDESSWIVQTLWGFYLPLRIAMQAAEPVREVVTWYMDLWEEPPK